MPVLLFLMFDTYLLTIANLATVAVGSITDVHGAFAGLIGILFAVLAMQAGKKLFGTHHPSLLFTSISSIVLLLNYSLFALIILRNPILQWPVLLMVTSGAALLLGGFGYHRANSFRDRRR